MDDIRVLSFGGGIDPAVHDLLWENSDYESGASFRNINVKIDTSRHTLFLVILAEQHIYDTWPITYGYTLYENVIINDTSGLEQIVGGRIDYGDYRIATVGDGIIKFGYSWYRPALLTPSSSGNGSIPYRIYGIR